MAKAAAPHRGDSLLGGRTSDRGLPGIASLSAAWRNTLDRKVRTLAAPSPPFSLTSPTFCEADRPRGIDRERLPELDELSPGELRVLRYLPTNLTRPEIACELYVSINTLNTHIRSIYSKLGARDRSSAVQHARDLRLLSTGRH